MSESATNKVIMTLEGVKKLEEELEYLKSVKRTEVADRIKVAISFGDLSENAEYDEAKNEQAFMEGRIAHIESSLRNALVIDEDDIQTDVVGVGAHVKVFDVEMEEEVEYILVGSTEADPLNGKISNESPVGLAILGRAVGDTVQVEVPNGTIELTIVSISK